MLLKELVSYPTVCRGVSRGHEVSRREMCGSPGSPHEPQPCWNVVLLMAAGATGQCSWARRLHSAPWPLPPSPLCPHTHPEAPPGHPESASVLRTRPTSITGQCLLSHGHSGLPSILAPTKCPSTSGPLHMLPLWNVSPSPILTLHPLTSSDLVTCQVLEEVSPPW